MHLCHCTVSSDAIIIVIIIIIIVVFTVTIIICIYELVTDQTLSSSVLQHRIFTGSAAARVTTKSKFTVQGGINYSALSLVTCTANIPISNFLPEG